MTKAELRKKIKKERESLDINKISEEIVQKILKLKEYQDAKNILIYYPLENEIDLLELLKDKEKNFYLPKIDGNNLLCCPYKDGDETCLSCFKTCEPLSESCDKNIIDIAIIPALACDKNGYRLGYGGGFYDRFLKHFNGFKLCCVPNCFLLDSVFPEIYDIKVDLVITD